MADFVHGFGMILCASLFDNSYCLFRSLNMFIMISLCIFIWWQSLILYTLV